MFKGAKPQAQPRSLRGIAEGKGTAPVGFDGQIEYDPQAGLPRDIADAQGAYQDVAEGARPSPAAAVRATTPADPNPFK